MLRELHVSNFALIDRLDLSFGVGLNILTGETGAGKVDHHRCSWSGAGRAGGRAAIWCGLGPTARRSRPYSIMSGSLRPRSGKNSRRQVSNPKTMTCCWSRANSPANERQVAVSHQRTLDASLRPARDRRRPWLMSTGSTSTSPYSPPTDTSTSWTTGAARKRTATA